MHSSHMPPAGDDQGPLESENLSIEDLHFISLVIGRGLIRCGLSPFPDFGLLQYDACTVLSAHSASKAVLPADLLHHVVRISRGEEPHPSQAVKREIERRARELLAQATALLRKLRPQLSDELGL